MYNSCLLWGTHTKIWKMKHNQPLYTFYMIITYDENLEWPHSNKRFAKEENNLINMYSEGEQVNQQAPVLCWFFSPASKSCLSWWLVYKYGERHCYLLSIHLMLVKFKIWWPLAITLNISMKILQWLAYITMYKILVNLIYCEHWKIRAHKKINNNKIILTFL